MVLVRVHPGLSPGDRQVPDFPGRGIDAKGLPRVDHHPLDPVILTGFYRFKTSPGVVNRIVGV